jgi:hypothetical protein
VTPTRAEPEEVNFVAVLDAVDNGLSIAKVQNRSYTTTALEPRPSRYSNPEGPPDYTSHGACGARSCTTTTKTPLSTTQVARRPRGPSRSGCIGRTSEQPPARACLPRLRYRQGRTTYSRRATTSAVALNTMGQRGNRSEGPLPSFGAG